MRTNWRKASKLTSQVGNPSSGSLFPFPPPARKEDGEKVRGTVGVSGSKRGIVRVTVKDKVRLYESQSKVPII